MNIILEIWDKNKTWFKPIKIVHNRITNIVDKLNIDNITPFNMGESTVKYTGLIDNQKVILRVYYDNYYGDRLNREVTALNIAGQLNINLPEILGIDKHRRVIVLEWVEGKILNNYNRYEKDVQVLLGNIQSISHDNNINFFDEIRSHTSSIVKVQNIKLNNDYKDLYRYIWDNVDLSWYDANDNVLIHGDFHPGNIIITHNGLSVIDWEYSSFGPKIFDICYLHRFIEYTNFSGQETTDVKMIIDLLEVHFNISFSRSLDRTQTIIGKYIKNK